MRHKLYKKIMEKLDKDLSNYENSTQAKEMKKDMKKDGERTKKDLEKFARDVEKQQDKESEMGFRHPSDISFTGTDAYTYIQTDYHELNPIKVQKMLDKQRSHPPGTLSSYTTRSKR